jgi:hypothetical protein
MILILTLLLFKDRKQFIPQNKEFQSFQNKYLIIIFFVYLGDWLQGSYQYQIYKSFGYSLKDIAIFFIVGYSSSLIFGTIIGSVFDK